MERASGVLLPVFSLPGPGGIGGFGRAARGFVDFLARSRQRYWQLLPLTTTSYGDSPYQSFSAHAGNPNFIDVEGLVERGWLEAGDLEGLDCGGDPCRIDYAAIFRGRRTLLECALLRFLATPPADLDAFVHASEPWLAPYCQFMVCKEEFGLGPFWEWPGEFRSPGPEVDALCGNRRERYLYHQMTQYLFFDQWSRLKGYANGRGVRIIGDIPIYVSRDSVEMWSTPSLFVTDESGAPALVAGTPPDQFSSTGQYWGNPIYDWELMREEGFSWWVGRLRSSLKLYDLLRIDHFRGFESYWGVPFGAASSAEGSWHKGPGMGLFERVRQELGELPIIAEDLGFLTPEVLALRDATGYPGMKILQFGFDGWNDSYYLPHHYTGNTVAYVGTHDNMTARGWAEDAASAEQLAQARRYLRQMPDEPLSAAMNRSIAASVSDTCIYAMQDLLDLGNEARINVPSTLGGNWCWRMREGALTQELEGRLLELTRTYCRVPGAGDPPLPQ